MLLMGPVTGGGGGGVPGVVVSVPKIVLISVVSEVHICAWSD